MKLSVLIPAIVISAASLFLFSTFAVAAQEPLKAAEGQVDKANAGSMQPHSHLHEKNGVVPQKKSITSAAEKEKASKTAVEEKSAMPPATKSSSVRPAKEKADKYKSKHFHPRDGK